MSRHLLTIIIVVKKCTYEYSVLIQKYAKHLNLKYLNIYIYIYCVLRTYRLSVRWTIYAMSERYRGAYTTMSSVSGMEIFTFVNIPFKYRFQLNCKEENIEET